MSGSSILILTRLQAISLTDIEIQIMGIGGHSSSFPAQNTSNAMPIDGWCLSCWLIEGPLLSKIGFRHALEVFIHIIVRNCPFIGVGSEVLHEMKREVELAGFPHLLVVERCLLAHVSPRVTHRLYKEVVSIFSTHFEILVRHGRQIE